MSAQGKDKDDWRWPQNARKLMQDLIKEIYDSVRSPYSRSQPPFCYPGTRIDIDDPEAARRTIPEIPDNAPIGRVLGELAAYLLPLQVNNIGTHTHEGVSPEEGFEAANRMEREAIYMIADTVSNDPDRPPAVDVPKRIGGYFCGGGTEANDMGMWIAREFLTQHPDPANRDIVVLGTPLTHYSIHKAAAKMRIGQSKWSGCPQCGEDHIFVPDPRGTGVTLVGMNARGEMDAGQDAPHRDGDPESFGDLERVFRLKYAEGFRRFIIVATAGTTDFGSIDPIERIARFITRVHTEKLAHCYLHVDASIGGFTIPFAEVPDGTQRPRFGFDVSEVMSIAIDGDKMGRLPYPAGVFLCRKPIQRLVSRQVMYIGSHQDDTFSGSRSCVAPVLAWFLGQLGRGPQEEYVRTCIRARNDIATLLGSSPYSGWVSVDPCSPYVNILPITIDIDQGGVPEMLTRGEGRLAPYALRFDGSPRIPLDVRSCTKKLYKLCIWPHTHPHLQQFADDLVRAREQWKDRGNAEKPK